MRKILLIILPLITALSSFGQIVSMSEKKYDKEGLHGNLELGFDFSKNQVQTLAGTGAVDIKYKSNYNSYLFSSRIQYSRVDSDENLNQGSFGLQYNYKVPDRLIIAEAFGQYEYNEIQSLDHRVILGGGPRFKIVDEDRLSISLVAYSIFLNEAYTYEALRTSKSVFKFSSMFTLSAYLTDNARVSHSSYYEPQFSNSNDYRFWTETTLRIKITDKFSFRTAFRLDYNSTAPEGVEKTYYSVRNSLGYTF